MCQTGWLVIHVCQSSGRVQRRACGLPYPASGRRSHPPSPSQHVFRHVRHGARDPAAARRFTCPIRPRRRPIVQWRLTGGRWFPGLSSGGRWPFCFPDHAPPVPSLRTFWSRHRPLCQSSAGGDGVLSLTGNGARSPLRAQRLKHRQQIGH